MIVIILRRILASCGACAGAWLMMSQPVWGVFQLAGYVVLAASLRFLMGSLTAFFAVTLALAPQCTDGSGNALRRIFFPLWVFFAMGGLLACLVLHRPCLGRQIDHGIGGP